MPRPPPASTTLLVLAALAALPAGAASTLRLQAPPAFASVPAATYDADERSRVGDAHLVLERLDEEHARLLSTSGFTAGARTVVRADLEFMDGGDSLRPVLQESRSFDVDGKALGRLEIDHAAGIGRCFDATGEPRATLELPAEDRVANVALHLMLRPLVSGETDEVHFQLFFCGLGTRVVDFSATRAPGDAGRGDLVEVRYGPDLGMASFVASGFVPKLSFWFASKPPFHWMAHRLPLYGNGPEVLVVRDGVPLEWLADD